MPGDRNSVAYSYVHIVLALRLPEFTVGIFAFMFSAQPLQGFHSQALTLQGKFEIHNNLKVIRCCLSSPSKSG